MLFRRKLSGLDLRVAFLKLTATVSENQIGDKLINPIVGVYTPVIRISDFLGWDDHSQYKGFRPQYGWKTIRLPFGGSNGQFSELLLLVSGGVGSGSSQVWLEDHECKRTIISIAQNGIFQPVKKNLLGQLTAGWTNI